MMEGISETLTKKKLFVAALVLVASCTGMFAFGHAKMTNVDDGSTQAACTPDTWVPYSTNGISLSPQQGDLGTAMCGSVPAWGH